MVRLGPILTMILIIIIRDGEACMACLTGLNTIPCMNHHTTTTDITDSHVIEISNMVTTIVITKALVIPMLILVEDGTRDGLNHTETTTTTIVILLILILMAAEDGTRDGHSNMVATTTTIVILILVTVVDGTRQCQD